MFLGTLPGLPGDKVRNSVVMWPDIFPGIPGDEVRNRTVMFPETLPGFLGEQVRNSTVSFPDKSSNSRRTGTEQDCDVP